MAAYLANLAIVMAAYLANLAIVLAAAGKMLAFLAPALVAGAAIAVLVDCAQKREGPAVQRRAQERDIL